MGRALDRLEQLAFAQLADLAQSGRASAFPPNGSFVQAKRNEANYWYYSGYEKPADGSPGEKTRTYVGPVGDPETERLRAEHEAAHERYRERRRIAAQLRRSGLPAPTPFDGAVVNALSLAGIFDAGAVLVGSMAFQSYSGLLGQRLDDALMQTGDVDIARPHRVLVHVPQSEAPKESLEALLKGIDPTFAPILDRTHPGRHLGYKNRTDYKVEFLTTVGRKSTAATDAVVLEDLDNVSAQPITFLEYLLEQPTRSVILHDDGVPVVVPDPARYGIHKLIVAYMRERIAASRATETSTRAKISKDISQASSLIDTLSRTHRDGDVADAWEAAFRRGPSWRQHLRKGVEKMRPDARRQLEHIVLSKIGPEAWRGIPTETEPKAKAAAPRVRKGADQAEGRKKPGGRDPFE